MSTTTHPAHNRFPWLIVLASLLSACSLPLQAPPTATPTVTPTPLAAIITETPTPTPTLAPDLARPCPITATRTPPPAAPTYGPDPNNSPRGIVDPHVEVCASQATIAVGETTTITALAIAIGIPHYRLSVAAGEDPSILIGVATYDGFLTPGAPLTGLELLNAVGSMTQVEFTLRGARPGIYTLTIVANGEVHYGYPGAASWLAVSSEPFVIQVGS